MLEDIDGEHVGLRWPTIEKDEKGTFATQVCEEELEKAVDDESLCEGSASCDNSAWVSSPHRYHGRHR